MIELTPDNVLDYLRRSGRIGPGPARVVPLGGGVSNAVFRVETPERLFVLKQSRPQLRTRDAWFSDLDRVYREQEVMQLLHAAAARADRPRSPVRRPAELRLRHEPCAARVARSGRNRSWPARSIWGWASTPARILGRMHEATAADRAAVEPFRDHTVFVQLRVDPFYRRIQERRPEVAHAVTPLIEQLLSVKEALCHGDYSPKNILTHCQGFTLVDYETAHLGDPTMDLGFFLSHLLLKALKRSGERGATTSS